MKVAVEDLLIDVKPKILINLFESIDSGFTAHISDKYPDSSWKKLPINMKGRLTPIVFNEVIPHAKENDIWYARAYGKRQTGIFTKSHDVVRGFSNHIVNKNELINKNQLTNFDDIINKVDLNKEIEYTESKLKFLKLLKDRKI